MIVQKILALVLLEHVGIGELLHNNENGDLCLLLDLFHLLMLALRRYPVHDHLDHLEHQVLCLVLRDVLFREVKQRLHALHLDGLLAQHQHPRRQRKDVNRYYVDDLRLWNEDLGLE